MIQELTIEFAVHLADRLAEDIDERKKPMCIAITKLGRLGWVPNITVCGDAAAITANAIPLILREVEEGFYKLVGNAYMHGIMDGEAVKDMKSLDKICIV